jgi:hypothetical protein
VLSKLNTGTTLPSTANGKCEAGKAELSSADGNTLGFTSTPLFIHGPGDTHRHITDEE